MALKWILHVDMDAFFASVEQMDNPALQGKPVVVGGGDRGVAAAASYEARVFGVRSAMPTATVKRLCPNVIFVRGRRKRYMEISRQVMARLGDFSPRVEPASIDEAYLDATGLERLFGPVESLAHSVKDAIREVTGGLTCSVGAAPVKFLAKIASDIHKPNGVYVLQHAVVLDFLRDLPVQKLPGVGKQFVKSLEALGICKAGQVLRYPQEFWQRQFGKAGSMLFARAQGIDEREVEPYTAPKSESAENTFGQDTWDRDVMHKALFAHAERVGTNLRKQGLAGRTITLKVKYADFTQFTRSKTLGQATNATQTIFDTACDLLHACNLTQRVRLIGLGVSGFGARMEQAFLPLALENSHKDEERRRSLDSALDNVRQRFGGKAVVRGRLFSDDDE